MKHSDSIASLAPALVAAQLKITNPAMDGMNPHFRSKYATLPGILSEVRHALADHGLCVIQSTGDGPSVTTRILHTSGEWLESDPLVMPPTKADPQGTMAALTYARRGSLCAMLSIAGEEDDDGNAASHQAPAQSRQGAPQHPPKQGPPSARPPAQNAGPAPEGLRFAMSECPHWKPREDGTVPHVFEKGPHREKWDGWKWEDLFNQAVDLLRAGSIDANSSALVNMVESEFVKGWNREQAEELYARAQNASKPDDEMNLNDVPF